MSVIDLAHQLAQALQESEEYRQFLEAKDKVRADESNYKMVKNFQLKQWEIQQAQLLQQEVGFEKQQELEGLYSLLSISPRSREYLQAEFQISRLMNDVQKIIGEAVKDALPLGFEENSV
ncbi:YlbF family regulator [Paradesulfitobacterium aromaticivorans]